MMLQEEIVFEEYYRCYCIGGKYVRIMPYEPRNPHHLRYVAILHLRKKGCSRWKKLFCASTNISGTISILLSWPLRDGVPYAIDFCNPAPDAEIASVGEDNFKWVVETAANYAIEKAMDQKRVG